MTQTTKIEWTDYTVNFWEGCQKVGPGCDNCYAEARDKRFSGGEHWGPKAPRRQIEGAFKKLRSIYLGADQFLEQNGRRPRVFCSSLSDIFDNAVDPAWRRVALVELSRAHNCNIQLLTKRVGNVEDMVPNLWRDGQNWPQNIGLMITVVNQAEVVRDVPKLLDIKKRFNIPWVGLSIEPMLGSLDVVPFIGGRAYLCDCGWQRTEHRVAFHGNRTRCFDCGKNHQHFPTLDWVICGGESGPNARPMHPDWVRDLRDQCVEAGTAFFFKQWGEYLHEDIYNPHSKPAPKVLERDGARYLHVGKTRAGRFLPYYGEISEFPKALS